MGIPSTGDRYEIQNYLMRELEKKYKDKVELVYPEKCVYRIFHDFARNAICEEFLKSNCDVLWFLDSDVCPPTHVLDLITEHWDKWELAGAPYPVWMTPAGYDYPQCVYTVYKSDGDSRGMLPARIPESGGTDFVDGIATGCLFIKRSVLERMQKPYFKFHFNDETRHMELGEDIHFCKAAYNLGIKFFIDYGMLCRHQKKVDLLEVNAYAVNFAKKYAEDTLMAYQRALRNKLAEKKLGLKEPKSKLIIP